MTRFFLLSLFVLFGCPSFSQKSSLLWEITGKNMKKASYLYGTMHLRDARVFQFGDSVLPALAKCEVVVGELVVDNTNPMALMSVIMLPRDTTLSMLMSEKDYSMVKEKAEEKLGFMATVIDNIKPFFTSALMAETEFQSDSIQFLDQFFQDLGTESGKKVIGIETIEEQIAAVDRVPLKDQAKMLLSSMKEDSTDVKLTAELLEIYLSQDLDSLEKFISKRNLSPEMTESVILHRNKIMAERIDTLIQRRSAFVAIGAAHLGGSEGVLEGLKKKGYFIRPVYSPFKLKPASSSVKRDENGWYIYETETYRVSFPSPYKNADEENPSLRMTIDQASGCLFTVSEGDLNKKADKFFSEKLKEYEKSGEKVSSSKKYSLNGIPALEIVVDEGAFSIKTVYCCLKEKYVELSITGKKEHVASDTTQLFLKSFRKK